MEGRLRREAGFLDFDFGGISEADRASRLAREAESHSRKGNWRWSIHLHRKAADNLKQLLSIFQKLTPESERILLIYNYHCSEVQRLQELLTLESISNS